MSDKLIVLSPESSPCDSQDSQLQAVSEHPVIAERQDVKPDFAGNVAIITLGCAKNTVDSEVMLGVLVKRGFRPVNDLALADLIVVNTCGFLYTAVEEGIDCILEAAKYKRTASCRKLIVAGCMVERYRADLEKSFPEVDRFISTHEILKIGEDEATSTECFDQARRPYFIYDESMPRVISTGGHCAYIKVAEGCDRPCSFCIIPKLRGSFRSRSSQSILDEARHLREQGIAELNLVAQDLTAYGTDLVSKDISRSPLVSLLKDMDRLPGNFWIRLLYSYPLGVTDALLSAIIESDHIVRYLDLPLQHVAQNVLQRMRRPLGEKGTRELIHRVRAKAPELSLRTTFIVGFPGETIEEIESLVQFVAEGHFAHVGVFKYSDEEEADSFCFPGRITEEEKEERLQMVVAAQMNNVRSRLANYVGKRLQVLVEGQHPETDLLYTSRAEWQAPETDGEVIINDNALSDSGSCDSGLSLADALGKFCEVEITDTADYDLIGTLVRVL